MKVADHTLLTPFISAERQTDRRSEARQGEASAGELPNYSKLQHFHLHIGPVRPATIVPVGFFPPFFPDFISFHPSSPPPATATVAAAAAVAPRNRHQVWSNSNWQR